MSDSREVFLETTIMVDAVCKDRPSQDKVKQILSDYGRSYTSNYVRMEFKKGYLQYLVYLHGKVVNAKDLAGVFEAISKLSSSGHRQRLGSILERMWLFYKVKPKSKLSTILEKYGDITDDEYEKEMLESHLSLLIRRSWKKFDRVVDEVINPTGCFVDIPSPQKKGRIYDNTPRTCDKSELKCEVRRFFARNRLGFEKIWTMLKRLPEPDRETLTRRSSLKKILKAQRLNREIMPQDCWNCSDAIIAIEAPEGSDIFNNNDKHYALLCETIGKKCVGYAS